MTLKPETGPISEARNYPFALEPETLNSTPNARAYRRVWCFLGLQGLWPLNPKQQAEGGWCFSRQSGPVLKPYLEDHGT